MGQSWFPKSWTAKDIRRAGEQVAGLKSNRHMPDGKAFFGVYKGVRVGIIGTNGKIATVFPDSDQSSVMKRRKKKRLKKMFEPLCKKRISTDDEWDYGVNQCWNEEIEILSRNIHDTIGFLETDCTADEFSWLSEVFEQIPKKTQSRAFVDCLYRVAKKYPNTCKEYHIHIMSGKVINYPTYLFAL